MLRVAGSSLAEADRTRQDTLVEGVVGTARGTLGGGGRRRLECRRRIDPFHPQGEGIHQVGGTCEAIKHSYQKGRSCVLFKPPDSYLSDCMAAGKKCHGLVTTLKTAQRRSTVGITR